MTREQLYDVVLAAISGVVPEAEPSAIDAAASFRDELDIDAMDFLAFVLALHERTGVSVPESDYPAVDSIEGAVSYLAAHA